MRRLQERIALPGAVAFAGLFLASCTTLERVAQQSAAQPNAAWARDLNEPPPPRRQQDSDTIAETKASLNVARERALR